MIISPPGTSLASGTTAEAGRAMSPEVLALCAAALGVKIPPERAQAAANGANAVLRTLARRAGTLRFESEPADYVVEIQRARQR